ncbi:MAG: ATP-binding protein [Candidatus Aenigmatarchaeota archaeon]
MPVEEIVVGREPDDLAKYGKRGCMFIGKHIVGTGFEAHLTNPVLMDASRPHCVLIVGKRGSGKSYTGAVIAEEIMNLPDDIKNNISVVMIDTMGIFWSMKNPNEPGLLMLAEWELKPKGFGVRNIVPIGLTATYDKMGIAYDGTFSIKPSALTAGDWCLTFGINMFDPLGILIERTIHKMAGTDYSIADIVRTIESDQLVEPKERMALANRFLAAEGWGIFSEKATPITEFMQPGVVTVLDVSLQDWSVRNLMIGILAREIYEARVAARREEETALISGEVKARVPLTWLIMDEAHNFVPAAGETAATHDLLGLVTMGRQPGISTVFITQQPAKLHETVITQADLVIAHRLTAKPDLDALGAVMQTYALEDIRKMITDLPKSKGSAVILDDNSERIFNIQVRPRQSWHAGGTPIAIK